MDYHFTPSAYPTFLLYNKHHVFQVKKNFSAHLGCHGFCVRASDVLFYRWPRRSKSSHRYSTGNNPLCVISGNVLVQSSRKKSISVLPSRVASGPHATPPRTLCSDTHCLFSSLVGCTGVIIPPHSHNHRACREWFLVHLFTKTRHYGGDPVVTRLWPCCPTPSYEWWWRTQPVS